MRHDKTVRKQRTVNRGNCGTVFTNKRANAMAVANMNELFVSERIKPRPYCSL